MAALTAAFDLADVRGRAPAGLSDEQRRLYARIPAAIDWVDHPSFSSAQAEAELFGAQADPIDVCRWTYFAGMAGESAATPRKRHILSGDDEVRLFLRYNYAKCRLGQLQDSPSGRPRTAHARQMVLWYRRVLTGRANLVEANMALVVAMAKRTRIATVDFEELISEGSVALLRSIEKFDVGRGFKLSTYACRAILKSFNRLATKTGRYRSRFPMEFDPALECGGYEEHRRTERCEAYIDDLRQALGGNEARLSDIERTVVTMRFAIGTDRRKGHTLAEVGRVVGLTNERVRQIQKAALTKLKHALTARQRAAV